MKAYANWYWVQMVLNRLCHFVWLHPAWTIVFIVIIFSHNHWHSK